MSELSDDQIQKMIADHIKGLLDSDLEWSITKPAEEPLFDEDGNDLNEMYDELFIGERKGKNLDQLKRSDYSEVCRDVDWMLDEQGIKLEKQSLTYKKICHFMLRALIPYFDEIEERATGEAFLPNYKPASSDPHHFPPIKT